MELQEREKLIRRLVVLKSQADNAEGERAVMLEAQIAQIQREIEEMPLGNSGTGQTGSTARNESWSAVENLVAASYRFVPLNKVVVPPENPATPHDVPQPSHGSARLTITWGIETPLLIGQPESAKQSQKGDNNPPVGPLAIGKPRRWVIPGATLRGVVRSSLEIIAFARLRQINGHFRFGVRDFTHALYRDTSPVGDDKQVRAGWLKKVGESYSITPCGKAGDDWGYVEITNLKGGDDPVAWSKLERTKKLNKAAADATHFTAVAGRALRGGGIGRMVYVPDSTGTAGELVVSGKAVGTKRYEYVFFADPNPTATPIEDQPWHQFELMNCRQGRSGLEPDGAWKELKENWVDKGKPVPVFWVGDLANQDKHFAFGLTRLFKIPHAKSVGDKVPCELKPKLDAAGKPVVDFVENLFGHVYERSELQPVPAGANRRNSVACRSRVAFGFARPLDPAKFVLWPSNGHHETIMMAPRASYAPYYLIGAVKDWSDKDSRLAGRKRYPPRYPVDKLDKAEAELRQRLKDPIERYKAADRQERAAPPSIRTKLRFLKPTSSDAAFESTIRMHNVSEVEMGALLWALTFGGDTNGLHRHMLGRAKGMGAGQTAVRKIGIEWRPYGKQPEKAVWPEDVSGLATRLMQAFEAFMEGTAPGWRRSETIDAYLKLHGTGTWGHLAGKLTSKMGAATGDERARVIARREADNGLANCFLGRPDPVDSLQRKTTNDFQRIREVSKLARKGIREPESSIPGRLLTIPRPPCPPPKP